MMSKFVKKGFNLTEVIVAIACISCAIVVSFAMFNNDGLKNNTLNARQARLDSALRTATMSITNKEHKLTAAQVCDLNNLRALLMSKIANSTEGDDIEINKKKAKTIKIQDTGLIAMQVSDSCTTGWDIIQQNIGTASPEEVVEDAPIVLYAIPDEEVTTVSVPTTVTVGETPADENKTSSEPLVAYDFNPTGLTPVYESTPELVAEAPQTVKAGNDDDGDDEEVNSCEAYEKEHPEGFTPVPNTKENACYEGSAYNYKNPCDPDNELPIYRMVTKTSTSCNLNYCEGNGEGTNGELVITGKVTNACSKQYGNADQCSCPQGRPFYIKEYKQNGISGLCVDDCCAVGMVIDTGYSCKCPEGTEWNTTKNKCTKKGSCPEEYLQWDGEQCVCNYAKVTLADDEIYSSDTTKACKEKCDTANYYFPNETKTECVRKLPECPECLKELNMQDYTCQCIATTTNEDMIKCEVPDNQYFTGTGSCTQECTYSYKVRNPQNITTCMCPATKPEDLKLGNFELYDTESTTCKSCGNVNVTNRIYDTAITNCECLPSASISFGTKEVYDITKANCKDTCPDGQIPDETHTYCYTPVCSSTIPSGFVVPQGKYYDATAGLDAGCVSDCPLGRYCPGNQTTDPNPAPVEDTTYPNGGVVYCPCGTYGATTGLTNYSCSGKCRAGYNCQAGSTSATQKQCTGKQLCKEGVCNIEECSDYRQPDENHTACVCKSADKLTYKGDNWAYDATQTDCQIQCEGIKIRNASNLTQCICPSKKPSTYSIPAGKQYDATQSSCLADCSVGYYCPGTNGDVVNNDPDDTAKIKKDENHPEVLKCLCGYYGSTTDNTRAKCNGMCQEGYNCPAGSTSPTQNKCEGSQLCPAGTCQVLECSEYREPDATHSNCVCKSADKLTYKGDNWAYDATQTDCQIQCEGIKIRNASNLTQCICPSKKPSTYSIPAGKQYDATQLSCLADCSVGYYCPGTNGDIVNNDPDDTAKIPKDSEHPEVLKCLCGYYGSTTDNTRAKCNGMCQAGYNCPAGSTSATQRQCTGNQLCKAGVCGVEECSQYREPDANHSACVCKSATSITYKGSNWVYDPTQTDCQYACEGIKVRSANDMTQCVCPSEKPSTYSIPAGKQYDPTQDFCIADCSVGYYCPGTTGDVVNNDPDDTVKIQKDADHPEVLKCLCGYYGSTNTNTRAKCTGLCQAGYRCPAGSTSATSIKCSDNELCPTGTCNTLECSQYREPDETHTACVCKSANEITFKGPNWVYDTTQYDCQSQCGGIKIRSTYNLSQCICPSSKPSTYSIPAGKQYDATQSSCLADCVAGYYCPGTNGDTVVDDPDDTVKIPKDSNHPEVLKCLCGYYGSTTTNTRAKCNGACQAGYNCPAGSTSSTQNRCTGNQLCKAGTCGIEECSQYREPDAYHTACVCKSATSITYKGSNWVYDATQTDCQTQCSGIKVRNTSNLTQCICPSEKPSTYSIPAGKQYDSTQSSCIADCIAGYYCPGTTGDTVNNDPDDTVKIPKDSNHPEVLKCLCGYYGSTTTNTRAKCNGACQAGYNCPAGSTSATQNRCTSSKVCYAGVCEENTCPSPLIANSEQTQCICPVSSQITLSAGYYYDSTVLTGEHKCQAKCPTSASAIATWISNNQSKFTNEKSVYDSTVAGCVSTCSKTNFIASVDRLECICGLSPNNVPAGKYLISTATECRYVDCPAGHYCPGSNPDPNPSPEQDPDYPSGVIICPCGTYGSSTGLSTYSCSGQCSAGYYCPKGSTSSTAHACSAGQICQSGTCTPGNCDSKFPLTSTSPYTSCSVCMTESAIKQKQPNYFGSYEVYNSSIVTGSRLCKQCGYGREYNSNGQCVCPADKPYIYNDTCNKCQNWGTLFFARNMSSSDSACTLYNFMKGDASCFTGGKARRVDDNMKNAAEKLSSTDKARTFSGVYAYMVSLSADGKTASVVGTFTIDSWYAVFPKDYVAYNARTYSQYRITGDCATMCQNNSECTQTCTYFKDKISSNTMLNSCKYVDTEYESRIGTSYGNFFDEFCSGGAITMSNGCVYSVGAFLRKYSSPLVLDLKGNGFKYTTVQDGVAFDLDKDGYAERISWTAKQTEFDDAFLVLDKNKNGQVDNGGELFGDQNGEENGYKELAKYDDNKDNVINSEDKIYSELLLWVDFNKNAKVDYDKTGKTSELKSLKEANVTEISLDYDKKLGSDGNILKDMYGNITGLLGSFKMMITNAAGKLVEVVRTMMDVFFMSA